MSESANSTTEAARCSKCGYLLLGLTEFRCPECGSPFDQAYLEDATVRASLLPWERPELGGRIRRLNRTLVEASLHPGRFFAACGKRKDRTVANPGSLIVASIVAALSLHLVAFFLTHTVFFFRFLGKHGAPGRALDTVVRAVQITGSTEWFLPALQTLAMLLSVFFVAILLGRVFRRRTGAMRTIDLAALHSPAVAFGAFIATAAQVTVALSHYRFMVVYSVAVFAQILILLLLVWHCCRKVLLLSRGKTVGTVAVCWVIQWGCGISVGYVLVQLQLLILGP